MGNRRPGSGVRGIVTSLSRHLTAPRISHGVLPYHPRCPVCRAERSHGCPEAGPLVAARLKAGLVAAALTGGFAAPAVTTAVSMADPAEAQAQASEPVPEGEGQGEEEEPGAPIEDDDEAAPGAVPAGEGGSGGPPPGAAPAQPAAPATPAPPPAAPAAPAQPAAPAPPAPSPPAAPVPSTPVPSPAPVAQPASPVPPAAPVVPEVRPEVQKGKDRAAPEPARGAGQSGVPLQRPVVAAAQAARAPEAAPATQAVPSAAVGGHRPPALARDTPGVHVVRPGETLWSIARSLLGQHASDAEIAREVHRLWELNARTIATGSPDLIMAGQRLRVR